ATGLSRIARRPASGPLDSGAAPPPGPFRALSFLFNIVVASSAKAYRIHSEFKSILKCGCFQSASPLDIPYI
ncbi:hypothetical protein, partial [Alcaligenes faecalis]|uniref:hypothetical protein n=1 Tax=Alcaligenes faecalis TaxID=511 RepID=UPI00214F9CA1